MVETFLSGSLVLLKAALWVFLAVLPLVWLDDHMKVRRILRGELSFREQREVEGILAELKGLGQT